jgi:hypothetical protein
MKGVSFFSTNLFEVSSVLIIYLASYVQNVHRNAYKPSYKVFVIVV